MLGTPTRFRIALYRIVEGKSLPLGPREDLHASKDNLQAVVKAEFKFQVISKEWLICEDIVPAVMPIPFYNDLLQQALEKADPFSPTSKTSLWKVMEQPRSRDLLSLYSFSEICHGITKVRPDYKGANEDDLGDAAAQAQQCERLPDSLPDFVFDNKEAEEECKCPICLQTVQDPVLLNCCGGQAMCRECVESEHMVKKREDGSTYKACPLCRKKFHGVTPALPIKRMVMMQKGSCSKCKAAIAR
ncbi:unnamed protein product, partial [Amoebophrya sp. A120]|eukprot:GSA120T00013057001.1